jgi:hypothetical protein
MDLFIFSLSFFISSFIDEGKISKLSSSGSLRSDLLSISLFSKVREGNSKEEE